MSQRLNMALREREKLIRIYNSTPEKRMEAAKVIKRRIRKVEKQIASMTTDQGSIWQTAIPQFVGLTCGMIFTVTALGYVLGTGL